MSFRRWANEELLWFALTPAQQQPVAAIGLERGVSGHPPPREELYHRTDFLLVKSSFLFKFHQSALHKKSLSDWCNSNKKLDFH